MTYADYGRRKNPLSKKILPVGVNAKEHILDQLWANYESRAK